MGEAVVLGLSGCQTDGFNELTLDGNHASTKSDDVAHPGSGAVLVFRWVYIPEASKVTVTHAVESERLIWPHIAPLVGGPSKVSHNSLDSFGMALLVLLAIFSSTDTSSS